jgi:hypothetical protein
VDLQIEVGFQRTAIDFNEVQSCLIAAMRPSAELKGILPLALTGEPA